MLIFARTLLFLLAKAVQANSKFLPTPDNDIIKECLEKICKNAFDEGPFFVISDSDRMLDYSPKLDSAQIIYSFEQVALWKNHFYFSNHLILVEDVRDIEEIFEKYRASPMFNPIHSPRGKVLILAKKFAHFEETVKYFWDNNFIDLMFINGTDVLTTYPYWPETKCGKTVFYKHVGNCTKDLQTIWEPFPKHLNDCVLNAASFGKHVSMPYLDDTTLFTEKPGILIYPLRLAASKYNLNVNYIVPNEELQLRKITHETTYFVDHLYKERIYDLLLAQIFRLNDTIGVYECSEIIFFEGSVWLTPKPKELSKLKVIFKLFELSLWLSLLVVLLLVTIILRAISNRNLSESLLTIYGITIGTCAYNLPSNFKSRCLLCFYLLFSLHVTFFFQSKLSSVLTSPNYELPINSFERLAHSNLHLYFYYDINFNTLKHSYNPYVSLLAKKSILMGPENYNPPEVVLTHSNYSANSYAHYSNFTRAHKQRVSIYHF